MSHWCKLSIITVIASVAVFMGCAELAEQLVTEQPTPTKQLMQGVWKVTEAYDANDSSLIDGISRPIAAFYLDEMNSVISTAGPMFTNIVYGTSNLATNLALIDQIFNYADLNLFTNGEFFLSSTDVVDRFSIEMKLKIAGAQSVSSLLQLFGIPETKLTGTIVYHYFNGVKVSFSGADNEIMYWEWDDTTIAEYNIKDDDGRTVLWDGWDTDSFTKCRFTLERQVGEFNDIVGDAYPDVMP